MALADAEIEVAGQQRGRLSDRRGLLFDIAMLAVNALLVPFLRDRLVAWAWTGVIAYTLGAALKSRPVRHRLALAGRQPWETATGRTVMGVLIGCVMMMALLFTSGAPPAVALLLPLLPAYVTGRALTPQTTGRLPRAWHEWVGDVLILYCAIFFSLIWDTATNGMHILPSDPLWARLIVVVVATPVFLMFYAPVRMLLLVEDGNRPSTWLRMAVVGLPFLRKVLIG